METVSNGTCPRTPSGLVVPRIHDNGSGKKRLLDLIDNAYYALDAAYQRVKDTAPNPRDYDNETFEHACVDHALRLKRIGDVHKELSELAVAISEQE